MNGGQLAQQQYNDDNTDNTDAAAAAAAATTTTLSNVHANSSGSNSSDIHHFLKMQPNSKQQVDAPSVTPAIATATGTANGSSNNHNNNNAPSAVATTANAAAAMNKKRKKDGLKPIITTENPHIGCVHFFSSTVSDVSSLTVAHRVRACHSSACISSPSCLGQAQ